MTDRIQDLPAGNYRMFRDLCDGSVGKVLVGEERDRAVVLKLQDVPEGSDANAVIYEGPRRGELVRVWPFAPMLLLSALGAKENG